MCQAQYGGAGLSAPPPSGSTPPSSATSAAAGATGAPAPPSAPANGTGADGGSKTHTIIVAPTQGVLRFGTSSLSLCHHEGR